MKEELKKKHLKIRGKIFGTKDRPRLYVFRSNQHTYASLINDTKGNTLASVNDTLVREKGTKQELAEKIGELIAKKALESGVKKVVFDRGSRIYHGRIKAVAEGARKGGLEF